MNKALELTLEGIVDTINHFEQGLDDGWVGDLCEGVAVDIIDELRTYHAALTKISEQLPATPIFDKWFAKMDEIKRKQVGN